MTRGGLTMIRGRAYGRTPSTPAQVNWFGLFLVGGVLLIAYVGWQVHRVLVYRQEEGNRIQAWLKGHGLEDYKDALYTAGIRSLNDVTDLRLPIDKNSILKKSFPPGVLTSLERAFQVYQDEVLLKTWLEDHNLMQYFNRLLVEGIHSLDALAHISEVKAKRVLGSAASISEQNMFQHALQALHKLAPNFNQYEHSGYTMQILKSIILGLFCVAFLSIPCYLLKKIKAACVFFKLQQHQKHSLLDFVKGQYLAPGCTKVEWQWTEKSTVGRTFHFFVKFFQQNGKPHPMRQSGNIVIEITQGSLLVTPTVQFPRSDEQPVNNVRVTFTIQRAGRYKISVIVGGKHIIGSPFEKTFLPGPVDPRKSQLVNQGSVVVGCKGRAVSLMLELHDSFDNLCDYLTDTQLVDKFFITMKETGHDLFYEPITQCQYLNYTKQLVLRFTVNKLGCYHTIVTYEGKQLKNSEFHILVLSDNDLATVEKAVAKKGHNVSFEARLLSTTYHSPSDKGKKIQCYLSPRQLTIKEFQFKIIPKKLFAFRVCPSTKFQFLGIHNQLEMPILSIEDGCQLPVLLATKDRDIIAATFSKHLMNNIGGSETFRDKQDFFYHEIRQLHSKRIHYRLPLKINREKLLESSVKATKHFSLSDWCKNFEVIFHQEEGLDWGGVRREWFELLCTEMFDPAKSGMFIRFKDDPQALVHPNHQHPPNIRLKHYEFAGKIVGKCLYESALGGSYKLQVKAKFTRSFLAQLIGLRINYKYFEKDDPDLFTTKICYIEDNDVEGLDLTFAEEEFQQGHLEKVVELIPNGAKTPVTNANKMKYLNLLAQYRLSNRVHDEIEAFLKGLNELIPDNLLSIFDENELELLMCGTGNYSIEDFKQHHTVSGSSPDFTRMLDWFWEIVSSYTQEEMACLLQFTTGSSQLPPGGFSQLTPKFQIIAAPTYKVLPTAHTCFNQLCLPEYDSLDEMSQALRLAITEGNQGFSMV